MVRIPGRPHGFTLVELLVVIAIIGILVALLMPAVQSAREAGRRASCANNIKQIGIALQNYSDNLRSYPPGWIATSKTPSDPNETNSVLTQEEWGWSALLLPYLEQNSLHDRLGVTKGRLYERLINANPVDPNLNPNPIGVDVALAGYSVLKSFMCPSDTGFSGRGRVSQTTPARTFNGGQGYVAASALNSTLVKTPFLVGVSNYMGVAGHYDYIDFAKNTGIFYGSLDNSAVNGASVPCVRPQDIRDGLSNQLFVGERETKNCGSGSWLGVRNTNMSGSRSVNYVIGHARPKLNQPTKRPNLGGIAWDVNSTGCGEGFSSFHPRGAQFLLGDGSVRFISDMIDSHWYVPPGGNWKLMDPNNPTKFHGTYQLLMTRDDKQVLRGTW